jgi:hypothetical protein
VCACAYVFVTPRAETALRPIVWPRTAAPALPRNGGVNLCEVLEIDRRFFSCLSHATTPLHLPSVLGVGRACLPLGCKLLPCHQLPQNPYGSGTCPIKNGSCTVLDKVVGSDSISCVFEEYVGEGVTVSDLSTVSRLVPGVPGHAATAAIAVTMATAGAPASNKATGTINVGCAAIDWSTTGFASKWLRHHSHKPAVHMNCTQFVHNLTCPQCPGGAYLNLPVAMGPVKHTTRPSNVLLC